MNSIKSNLAEHCLFSTLNELLYKIPRTQVN